MALGKCRGHQVQTWEHLLTTLAKEVSNALGAQNDQEAAVKCVKLGLR